MNTWIRIWIPQYGSGFRIQEVKWIRIQPDPDPDSDPDPKHCLFYTLISYLWIWIRIRIQFWTRIQGRQMNIDPTGNGSRSKSTSLIRTSELNEPFSRTWGTKLMMVAFEVILEPFEVNFGAIWIQQKILVLKIDFARKYFFFCMYEQNTERILSTWKKNYGSQGWI